MMLQLTDTVSSSPGLKKLRYEFTEKQDLAFDYLMDKETNEILFGGGAGGGKSVLGCVWLVTMCVLYPGTRYLMGRAILKTIKESTLLTFFRVCKEMGLKKDVDYKYHAMQSIITFNNESEIYLKDLYAYPSDPEFDELGSTEYTSAFIDEASQVSHKAYMIVMSRLRYRLDEYGIIPKILTATNPTKNFLYAEFYKPYKAGELKKYRKFIPALVQDNQFISKYYIENLQKLDKVTKERLLLGNWEYDDDPSRLFEYDKILDMFTNSKIDINQPKKYLTVDVARYGDDKTVVVLWEHFKILKIEVFSGQNNKQTREFLEKAMAYEHVPRSQVIIDEDGIGGGIVDEMIGVKGFVNNSRPLESEFSRDKHNFMNLKSQCYFFLAQMVNENKISIYSDIPIKYKELIIEDLEQIKRKDADKDGKLAVIPKEEMKEILGRSTDIGDAIMMRMWFLLKKPVTPYISV